MKISNARHYDYIADVPVADLTYVLAIFWLFLNTKGPNDNSRLSERVLKSGGLDNLASNLPADARLEDIKNEILTKGKVDRKLGYDPFGVGKLYSLRCTKDPQSPATYLLKMMGGGDTYSTAIEQEIAEVLDAPRDWHYLGVEIEVPSENGKTFCFDFEQILRKTDSVLGATNLKGQQVVAELMGQETGATPWAILVQNEDFIVRLAPESVGCRYDFRNSNGADVWKSQGSCLIGPLYNFSPGEPFLVPTVMFVIVPRDTTDSNKTFRDPELKEKVALLVDNLIACFQM